MGHGGLVPLAQWVLCDLSVGSGGIRAPVGLRALGQNSICPVTHERDVGQVVVEAV